MLFSSPSPVLEINTIVFIDYLTKWSEVFATSDQTALTIAKLLVENKLFVDMECLHNYCQTVEKHFYHTC